MINLIIKYLIGKPIKNFKSNGSNGSNGSYKSNKSNKKIYIEMMPYFYYL